jgi:ubiquitin-conjugating enzyme E2 J2
MSNNLGIKRLHKEHKDLLESKTNINFVAEPDPDNIFDWHFCIYGLKECPYEGGFYHGMLKFPKEYPMKPPSVMMITPSGRFEEKERICLTISDYHPESWNPVWKVESILFGLMSFMLSDEDSVGSLDMSEKERKQFAKKSLDWNMKNKTDKFAERFDKYFVKMGLRADPNPPAAKEEEKGPQADSALGKRASGKGAAAKDNKEEEKGPAAPATLNKR